MNRAYASIEVKSTQESGGKRTFTGIASTPSADRVGDIVDPKGAQFTLPLPLLWQHDARDPIGWITAARVTSKGIEVDGEVADIPESGPVKERLLKAWQMLKAKLVRGLSIGFNSIESARIDGIGVRYLKWEWIELSAVTIPANADCSITAIKSADHALLRSASTSSTAMRGRTATMPAHVRLNSRLQLEVAFGDGKSLTTQLDRISAQRLADELREFAAGRKSVAGAASVTLPATEVASTDAGRKPGCVYVDRPTKKAGVIYVGRKATAGIKCPVVRLKG